MTRILRCVLTAVLFFCVCLLCKGADKENEVINLPIYKQWWAHTIYLVTIFGAAVLYAIGIKRRQKERIANLERDYKEEVQKTKSDIVNSITEELSVLITFILGLSNQIRQQIGNSENVSGKLNLMEYNIGKINNILNILQDSKGLSEKMDTPREIMLLPISQLTSNLLEILKIIIKTNKVRLISDIEKDIILTTNKDYYQTLFNSLTHKFLSIASEKGELSVSLKKSYDRNGIILKIKTITSKEDCKKFLSEKSTVNLHDRLVEIMNGSISYDYDNGKIQATVFLPQYNGNRQICDIAHDSFEKSDSKTLASVNQLCMDIDSQPGKEYIYIVSTNKEISSFIGYFLSVNYNIRQFHDNMSAFQGMDTLLPAAVIYDYSSLRDSFSEYIERIKSNKRSRHITVITLASSVQMNEKEECIRLGADLSLSFPFNVEHLQTVLEKQIDKREKIAEYFNSPLSSYEKKNGKIIHMEDKAFYHRILDIIHENISNPELNASLVAKELGLSLRVMYRRLENIESPNLNQMIIDTRLKLAVKYLTKSRMTIDEILYKVGYENRSTFYRNFKNSYGMTPKEYREQIQNKTLEEFI